MKKIFALLLVLVLSSACMFSCKWLKGDDEDKDNDKDNSSETDPEIEEDDGDVDQKDNIDPDGWTKVDK